jgi:hypothetical protein
MRVPLLLLLLVCTPVVAQQQFGAGGPGGAPQPLHDVLMMVFDKDHDGKVTMGEVTQTMGSLEALLSEGGDPASGENPYLGMLQGAQAAAPHLFTLLDADASEGLTKAELKWVTKFQKALKSGAARNLTRDVFNAVDVDPTDDKLSAAEVAALADAASPVLAAVADLVHAAFPLRRSADDLKGLLKGLLLGTSGGGSKEEELARSGIAFVDGNGDGFVDRKEAGKAFSAAKKSFLEVAKTVQQMGPMMAMFGGGGMGGMGGMGEF